MLCFPMVVLLTIMLFDGFLLCTILGSLEFIEHVINSDMFVFSFRF